MTTSAPGRSPAGLATTAMVACAGMLLVTLLAVRWSAAVRDVDARLFDTLSGAAGNGSAMRLVAGIADPVPFAILGTALVALTATRGMPRRALAMLAMLVLAAVATESLKLALREGTLEAGAFPSGHTGAAVALAICLVAAAPDRWRRAALTTGAAIAAAVGIAVVLLGRHAPSDVVGGALVAGTIAGVVAMSGGLSARR